MVDPPLVALSSLNYDIKSLVSCPDAWSIVILWYFCRKILTKITLHDVYLFSVLVSCYFMFFYALVPIMCFYPLSLNFHYLHTLQRYLVQEGYLYGCILWASLKLCNVDLLCLALGSRKNVLVAVAAILERLAKIRESFMERKNPVKRCPILQCRTHLRLRAH